MNWEPSRADHSIERVTVQITLASAVGPDEFDDLAVATRRAAHAHHLMERAEPQPMPFPAGVGAGGAVVQFELEPALQLSGGRRVAFRRLDTERKPVDELSVTTQQLMLRTWQYRRWSHFYDGLLKPILDAISPNCPSTREIKAVRLEYLDRFKSTTPSADHFEIVSRESQFLVAAVGDKSAAFHVHSGWFDFDGSVRQLTNVNVDVTDAAANGETRKIGILTMAQYEALEGSLDHPIERIDKLHGYLKTTYSRIITQVAAARVALNG